MAMPRWNSLLPDEHPASDSHVRRCPECRGRLETERRYLMSLRQVQVPRASVSLQERLLEQTQHLAAQAELAERTAPGSRTRSAVRMGLTAIAGAAACAAALAVTAYAVAGEPLPRGTAGGGAAAFSRTATGAAQGNPPAPGPAVLQTASQSGQSDEPLDRLGRGLRVVFGASGRP
jgi:hypothetical protein